MQGFSADFQGGGSSRIIPSKLELSASSSAMIHSVPEWQHRRCCQSMATSAARSSPGTSVPAVLYSPASDPKKKASIRHHVLSEFFFKSWSNLNTCPQAVKNLENHIHDLTS